MLKVQCSVLCVLGLFILESNSGVVSFVKPCLSDDNACMVSSAQNVLKYLSNGIPELNIPASEPLLVKSVQSDDTDFKLEFHNILISGVSQTKVVQISRNPKEGTITTVFETPLLGKGQYKLKGKIFIIEAFGQGDFEIKTDKVIVTFTFKIKNIEKDGKQYWKITGYDYHYDLEHKVYIKLDNLFDGDEKRAAPFKKLLDEGWKELVTEIGDPLLKDVIAQYVNIIKQFFLSVPIDELEIQKN